MTTLTIQPSVPTYEVYKVRDRKTGKTSCWVLARTDKIAFIGRFPQRNQAIQAGRMLAGWRGQVVVRR